MKKIESLVSLCFILFITFIFLPKAIAESPQVSVFSLSEQQSTRLKRQESQQQVNVSPSEGNSNHINYFKLEINSPLAIEASVHYKTLDGTAKAGEDYIATSGIARIPAGDTNVLIAVEIIGDSKIEPDETFYLVITNPVGAIFPKGVPEIIAKHTNY